MESGPAGGPEREDDASLLLETVVAAHYLAAQMRMLAHEQSFLRRQATEFIAAALSEWARRVEEESTEAVDPYLTAKAIGSN